MSKMCHGMGAILPKLNEMSWEENGREELLLWRPSVDGGWWLRVVGVVVVVVVLW